MSIAAFILAAGRSTRFGAENKLLAQLYGVPMLARVIRNVKAAGLTDVIIITGHEAKDIAEIAAGEGVATCHNPDFAQGLSTSLKAGIAALPEEVEAALILLGDMPLVQAQTIAALRDSAAADAASAAFVPVYRGEWGNPVLLRRALFAPIMRLQGDQGARKVLAAREDIALVAVDDPGILADFDTKTEFSTAQASRA